MSASGWREASVTIAEQPLLPSQVMTLRVAVVGFLEMLNEPDALGDDEHARQMRGAYQRQCRSILALMGTRPAPPEPSP